MKSFNALPKTHLRLFILLFLVFNSLISFSQLSQDSLFEDYQWLKTIVSPEDCTNETITLYETGPNRYLYVKTDESSRLFNSEGALYCTNAPNYDCLAAYNLTEVVTNWSCQEEITPLTAQTATTQEVHALLFGADENCTSTFEGASDQLGMFTKGSSSIGFETGIILSTGNVVDVTGPNSSTQTSTGYNTSSSDSDLEKMIGISVLDVAYLEFDMVAISSTLEWEYVFASEEYCEYVGSNFTDVFGIFVSGLGIDGPYDNGAINIATVPETGEDVSIQTINASTNQDYYISNARFGDNLRCDFSEIFSPKPYRDLIEYDGFTVPLKATVTTVPGAVYHVKIAIGDVEDKVWDSALFLNINGVLAPSCNGDSSSAMIFNDYSWLSTIVDPTNCMEATIDIYQTGPHQYLYITDANGSTLYNATGQLYCTGSANYDCLAAYNLTTQINSWSCNNSTTEANPPTNDTTNNDPTFFEDFPWIETLVNSNDCNNGTDKVTVYTAGAYQYVYVENADGEILYNASGQLYCTGSANYDCLAAYNLSEIAHVWNCGSNIDNAGNNTTANDYSNHPLFIEYPWLNDNEEIQSCPEEFSISVYDLGTHSYLFLEIPSTGSRKLYYQTGQLYCTSTATYNCLDAYNLSAVGGTFNLFTCNTFTAPTIENFQLERELVTRFKVFPNPASNHITIELPPSNLFHNRTQEIQLINTHGQVVRSIQPTSVRTEIAINDLTSGLYFVQWKSLDKVETLRLVVE